jgi:hypothetical protein
VRSPHIDASFEHLTNPLDLCECGDTTAVVGTRNYTQSITEYTHMSWPGKGLIALSAVSPMTAVEPSCSKTLANLIFG